MAVTRKASRKHAKKAAKKPVGKSVKKAAQKPSKKLAKKPSKKPAKKVAPAKKSKPAQAKGSKPGSKSVNSVAPSAAKSSAKPNPKQNSKKTPVKKTATPKPPVKTDEEIHAPSHSAKVVQPMPLPAPSSVLPVRKAGEEAPKPGASGRVFDDEDELEEFDPLFDEVREEKD